ncbi:hypothetical protein EDB19DRAFT_338665 [Suillus lakei]|nr:hypothetical protein EDB19DRAFT_338665 [Suillus lakei]
MLDTTINLCPLEDDDDETGWFPFLSEACPHSVLEQLSHVLPYHFVTGRVYEDGEELAITVISKLLSSPSSPSTQIVANCTLLACVMVGVQVDKKDIVRIDKSSALPRLREALLVQFQKVLWAWDGGRSRQRQYRSYTPGMEAPRRYLSRARVCSTSLWSFIRHLCGTWTSAGRFIHESSEQDYPWDLLDALQNALHFMFIAANVSRDPARVWNGRFWCKDNSHSSEDFDWLVDYLDYIDSDDHEAAYDILLVLGSVGMSCSRAKQYMFAERLIACMGGNVPNHVRHAALRAAHSAREEIASIDAIDDARLRDMLLTKLSPAILSVLCPRPSPTPVSDSPGYIFDSYESQLVLSRTGLCPREEFQLAPPIYMGITI